MPKTKLIETDNIEVYSDRQYIRDFLARLVSYYTKSKSKVLDFLFNRKNKSKFI